MGTLIGDEDKFELGSDGDDYGLKVTLAKGESILFPIGDKVKATFGLGGTLNVARPYANDVERFQSSPTAQVVSSASNGGNVANPFTTGEALVEQIDSSGITELGLGDYVSQGFMRITNRSSELLHLINILATAQASKTEKESVEDVKLDANDEDLRDGTIPVGHIKVPVQQSLGTTPQVGTSYLLSSKVMIWYE